MTTVDLPGLVVPIEARIDRLEKALKKASQAQSRTARDMERRAAQSADRMARSYESAGGRMSTAFKAIAMPKLMGLAGAVAGIGVAGSVGAVRQTVRGIAEIGDAAKRAGIQVEAFQEWKYVADQNRIGIDALTDGFKELNLRADEFIQTGGGSAADAFKRLGFGAAELNEKLKDPSALMLEIIKRMEGLDKAAQIRVADEVFGGAAGERFVELLDRGAAGISAQITRARELGIVLDEGAVRKATELDAKFSEVQTRLQSMWRGGVVEAATYFGFIERERARLTFDQDLTGRVVGQDVANSLGDLPEVPQDALSEIEGLAIEYAQLASEARLLVPALSEASNMMRGLGKEADAQALTGLATKMGDAARAFEDGTISGAEYADILRAVAVEAETTIAGMGELDQARLGGVIGQVAALLDWINALPGAVATAKNAIASIALMDTVETPLSPDDPNLLPPTPRSKQAPDTSPRPRTAPFELGVPDLQTPGAGSGGGAGGGSAGGGGGGRSSDEFASAIESLQRETFALDAEAVALLAAANAGTTYSDAIEVARTKADLLNAAQRDGRAITPELTAQIDQLAQAHLAAGNAAASAADGMRKIEDQGKKGAEALSDVFGAVLDGSMTAEEGLKSLLLQIAKVQLQKQLMNLFGGTGAGAGMATQVGSLLGFADGGYTGAGGTHEPAGIVHRGEYVFSKTSVGRIGADTLDRLHQTARKGYATGGLVSATGKLAKAAGGRPVESVPVVSIHAPITVNASGGTPEQNSDLARQMAAQSDQMFRNIVQQEMVRQMRPGGMLR
jgi:hypothetical protein